MDNTNWDNVDRDADAIDYAAIQQVIDNINKTERTDFTQYDRDNLKKYFLKNKNCKTVLEIGVENNPASKTSTSVFLSNKSDDVKYFGIDIEDRSYLNNDSKNVYTLMTRSENIEEVMSFLNSKGVTEIDFLFIDGWHSINQVIKEFEYTQWLSKDGIVGFHDINHHPGPKYFLEKVIDRSVWEVVECRGEDPMSDFGVAFAWRK